MLGLKLIHISQRGPSWLTLVTHVKINLMQFDQLVIYLLNNAVIGRMMKIIDKTHGGHGGHVVHTGWQDSTSSKNNKINNCGYLDVQHTVREKQHNLINNWYYRFWDTKTSLQDTKIGFMTVSTS